MSAVKQTPPPLVAVYCPDCLKRGKRNVIIKAAPGARVEAFCWHCRFRRVIII